MLDVEVLQELQRVASQGEGSIFEVGPYIGGSTVAMASGHRGRRRHVVIEAGGAYPDQPHLPSHDIIGDLERNLERYDLRKHVSLHQGWSNDNTVYEPALQEAGPIGLFFFDANGAVEEQLSICAKYFRDDCVIVLDDYGGDHAKTDIVTPAVDRLVARGAIVLDKLIDSTWFGRLGTTDRSVFEHFAFGQGHSWFIDAPDHAEWDVEMLEDGRPLGRRVVSHDVVRAEGRGAWSPWTFKGRHRVLFSTPDNTDPNLNGRTYSLRTSRIVPDELVEARKISMLGIDVMRRLRAEAAKGQGGILEIGSYIGGSTISLALGHKGSRKHSVVEAGGSYPTQPHIPTDDIIGDLKANLTRFGCIDHVQIFQGWSNDPTVIEPAMASAGPIGLFFFDANGAVEEQLSISAKCFRDDCVIVLDDYGGDHAKTDIVTPAVDRLVARGALVCDEVIETTWFGRMGTTDRSVFEHFAFGQGHSWFIDAPDHAEWVVEMLEDGRPIGPRVESHDVVRAEGKGAWSPWTFKGQHRVLFSTPDNTNPNLNGRTYSLRVTRAQPAD